MCKVLIADDSDIMRKAIRKTLQEETDIHVVGEASTFAETMQMVCDFKPDVLLLDLHLAEQGKCAPDQIQAQLGAVCTLAMSFATDGDSKSLAKRYGAAALLDKMTLYTEMLPAIRQLHPALTLRKNLLSRAADAS